MELETLEVKIQAQARQANGQIDALITRLGKLSSSLQSIDSSGINRLSTGVNRLSNSMSAMRSVDSRSFSTLARNIKTLSNIDTGKINAAAGAMRQISKSVSSFSGMSKSVQGLAELAGGIKQLGYTSSTKAIENIPKLAVAMRQLMAELSKAPMVSQNLINMTNALAKLARTGGAAGTAAKSITGSFSGFSSSASSATKKSFSLASAIGKLYASYFLLFRGFGKIKDAIDIASSLTEVENVVRQTFGQYESLINNFAKTSIEKFGMSELSVKQFASRFQAMGVAMGFSQGKMTDMSINLTKLTADMASFYDVAQSDVAEDLESIFTGQTRPLRAYGLDLTQATLKEWALTQGIEANFKTMTQAEKAMLRYQYVMANTAAAQGDFARTADTWHNQITMLKENFKALGAVVGGGLINAFKPFIKVLNAVLQKVISFAEMVTNALGSIFGWKYEASKGAGISGLADDIGSASDGMDDLSDAAGSAGKNTGGIAKNAKKAKKEIQQATRAFDELKVISKQSKDNTSGSGSGGSGSGGGSGVGGSGGGNTGKLVKTDTIFKDYESKIKDLEGLGEAISGSLISAMQNIDWDSVYAAADGFGTGLAQFLNGLFKDQKGTTLFGEIGTTVAGALNTVINASLGFTDNFDFEQFGINLSDAVNNFFTTFDFAGLADAINGWVDGFWETVTSFFGNLEYGDIFNGLKEFITNLSSNTIATIIGIATIKKFGGRIVKSICDNVGDIGGKLAIKLGEKVGSIALTSVLVVGIVGVSFSLAKSLSEMFFDWYNEKYGTDYDTIKIEDMSFLDVVVSGFKLSFNENGKFQILGLENLKKLFPENEVVNTIYGLLNGSLLTAFQNLSWDEFWSGFSNGGTGNLVDDVKKKISDVFSGIGDWFDKNVASPVSDTFEKMCISISGFFSGLWNGIKKIWEKVSSWFNDKVVSPVSGFFEGLCTRIGQFFQGAWLIVKAAWKIVSDWFNEKVVTPIKTKFGEVKTKIENAFKDAKQYVIDKWNSIKDWFESNVIAPIKTKFGSVKDKITKSFGDAKQSVTDKWSGVKKWFSEHVLEPIKEAFKKTTDKIGGFFTSLWKSIKSGVASAFNSVISGIESAINGIVGGINKLISGFNNVAKKAGEIVGQDYSGVDKVPTVSLPRIKGYKAGGFPDRYSLFMAGENGIPEIAGTVGGKPAVAGGAEITGIKDAINSTSAQEVFLLRQQNQLLQAILQKNFGITTNDIGKAARDYGREYYNRTGDNVYVF